jgi:hypothetical protein
MLIKKKGNDSGFAFNAGALFLSLNPVFFIVDPLDLTVHLKTVMHCAGTIRPLIPRPLLPLIYLSEQGRGWRCGGR